jgi:hypothetical protein
VGLPFILDYTPLSCAVARVLTLSHCSGFNRDDEWGFRALEPSRCCISSIALVLLKTGITHNPPNSERPVDVDYHQMATAQKLLLFWRKPAVSTHLTVMTHPFVLRFRTLSHSSHLPLSVPRPLSFVSYHLACFHSSLPCAPHYRSLRPLEQLFSGIYASL